MALLKDIPKQNNTDDCGVFTCMVSLNMNLHNEAEYIAIYLVSVYAMFGCGGCIPHTTLSYILFLSC